MPFGLTDNYNTTCQSEGTSEQATAARLSTHPAQKYPQDAFKGGQRCFKEIPIPQRLNQHQIHPNFPPMSKPQDRFYDNCLQCVQAAITKYHRLGGL